MRGECHIVERRLCEHPCGLPGLADSQRRLRCRPPKKVMHASARQLVGDQDAGGGGNEAGVIVIAFDALEESEIVFQSDIRRRVQDIRQIADSFPAS